MTLFRIIFVLLGGLTLMLGVVILRADTTRLHYLTSQHDAHVQRLREQIQRAELELQRLKNPMLIRHRAGEMRLPPSDPPPPAGPRAPAAGPAKKEPAGQKLPPKREAPPAGRKGGPPGRNPQD